MAQNKKKHTEKQNNDIINGESEKNSGQMNDNIVLSPVIHKTSIIQDHFLSPVVVTYGADKSEGSEQEASGNDGPSSQTLLPISFRKDTTIIKEGYLRKQNILNKRAKKKKITKEA